MHKFLGQRYVDDTFTIMPDIASAEIFLDTLNHCHPSAKFTMEVERNASASFHRCWTVKLSYQNQDQGLRKTN